MSKRVGGWRGAARAALWTSIELAGVLATIGGVVLAIKEFGGGVVTVTIVVGVLIVGSAYLGYRGEL